jgi:hypothetical protein
MENKEWEDQLRDILGKYKSPDGGSSMGTDPQALTPSPEEPSTPSPDQIQAWKRIEASLDAADQAFDETIRHKINHFNPPYEPHTWPLFVKRLADTRNLRAKLIVLKSVEVAILLLLILSAVNLQRMGKMPFDSNLLNSAPKKESPWKSEENKKDNQQPVQTTPTTSTKINNDFTQADQDQNSSATNNSNLVAGNNYSNNNSNIPGENSVTRKNLGSTIIPNAISSAVDLLITENQTSTNRQSLSKLTDEIPALVLNGLEFTVAPSVIPDIDAADNVYITEPIAVAGLTSLNKSFNAVPDPKFIEPLKRTYTEFGMLAQADYNALKMPEDHLYSSGREIIFPSKGILSPGYGAGFTIAIGHPIWALETGVIYSAKDFEPGRQLIVGGAFDNGSVDFEAMKLQVVSLPMQFRYRFDHKGRLKAYGIGGGGFHVIAESNIDVQVKYHFPSLAFGENPNNDPNLAETIQETRRIQEHIRDGAPLSTKSFVSANVGLGVEYMLTEHKAIFLQTVAQYQIPNIAFSNNNGKHLRSVSLQAGIRGPLGK